MKRVKNIILLLLITFLVISNARSQTKINLKDYSKIDVLNIFPPIGYINCLQDREIIPNDSLNKIFISNFKEIIPSTGNFQISILDDENELSDTLKKYFVETIPKISKLSNDVFSTIPLGNSFNEIIQNMPGRFFGIVFYQGFDPKINLGKEIAKSVAIGLATAALTGGLFYATTVPIEPYLNTHLVIIDKEKNKFLYYKRKYYTGSPLDKDKLQINYTKIFNKYHN